MRKLFWTAALALALSSLGFVPASADPAGEAAPTLQELERQIFGPAEKAGQQLAEAHWWCCFQDSDCYPYGGTRCVGGQVCGVCLP